MEHAIAKQLVETLSQSAERLRVLRLPEDLIASLEQLAAQVDQPCVLAVVGRMKAGKSTFLNALLGEDLACVGVTETTATIVGILAGIFAFPVGGLVAIGAAIWAGFRGWQVTAARQLQEAQRQLRGHLNQILSQLRSHYLDVNPTRPGMVEEFFTTAERQLSNKIHQLTTQKLAETQAEINRMLEEEKFNDAERQAKAEALNKQLAQWDALRQDIQEIGNALQDMERNMAASLPR